MQIKRVGLLAAAVVVLVAAFVLFSPKDNDNDEPTAPRPAQAPATTDTTPPAAAQTTAPAAPRRPDPGPLLRKGKVTKISVNRGDTVRLRAVSSTAEELHVHGYDITRDLKPGKTARVAFKAKLEGIFEIELEHSGIQVAELRVDP